MHSCVLDASALLVFLNREPGHGRVQDAVPGAVISTVNLAEVVGKLRDAGAPEDTIRHAIDMLGLSVADFDIAMAFEAGKLRPATRALGLSLGDRACLATAGTLRLPVLTADRSWLELKLGVKIHCVR